MLGLSPANQEEGEEGQSPEKCSAESDAAQLAGLLDIPVEPIDPALQPLVNSRPPQHQQHQHHVLSIITNPNTSQNQQLLSSSPPHPHQQLSSSTPTNTLTAEAIERSLSPYRVGKNWACRVCGRQFTRRFNCTTHERTHLDLAERAQFQCGLCEHAFTRRHDLKRHIHSVHPGHALERGTNRTMKISASSDPNQLESMSPPDHQLSIRTLQDHQAILSCSLPSDPLRNPDQVRILVIDPSTSQISQKNNQVLLPPTTTATMSVSSQANSMIVGTSTSIQIHGNMNNNNDNNNVFHQPTAILASGSIREVSQAVERVPLDQLARFNPNQEPIFKYDAKWACGTCGRIFVRRNNCKAHEATHRDIRQHQCSTCSRSFSRKHDLERHILAVHPEIDLSETETTSARQGPYTSSDLHSSQKKRKKQQGANEAEDWAAIDPMILSVDHQPQHMSSKSAKPNRKGKSSTSNNPDQTRKITNHRHDDDRSEMSSNEIEEEHQNNNRGKRSGRSVEKISQPKSKTYSNLLEHLSHRSTSNNNNNNNTIHSFNIFETFDPNPTIESTNDLNNSLQDNNHTLSHYATKSTVPLPLPPTHPTSSATDSNPPIPFDPRLFNP